MVLALLGALVGAGSSVILSPGYRTTSSVLLQGPREADELLTQAEVATSSVVLDRAAAGLGDGETGADLRDKVATSVAQGNVITIEATGDTAEQTQRMADRIASEFVKYSTQIIAGSGDAAVQLAQERRETLRQQVVQTNQRISELSAKVDEGKTTVESVQLRTELQGLRSSIESAMSTLNAADTASGLGNMVVLGSAELPSSAAAPTLPQLALGGAALFFLVGLFGHLFRARTDRRLRGEEEIAAAIGGPVLATFDAVERRHAGTTLRAKLLRDDRPWNIPRVDVFADEIDSDVLYRRLVSRLPHRRLLVMAADGDHAGQAAAARLAAFADRWFTVVTVNPARPVVEDTGADGVLVVASLGSRSAWELVGIAEAVADAGLAMVGTVLIRPVRPTRTRPAASTPTDHEALAGTA
ncbi:exopolysaccharide biosynthesis protein [Amycolatopsis decaplanina DSM 44594]|uniref:Exopolysaccharide biosynthesis protein n=1 Tax=Amycolatopsis decaplanina DSM 44594 TaxID=1284240 RepID=M2XHA3_9PSEU|nr:exopolysaccharide biosynthesis protein [Amycolatopsis decaplanina DSM 44594]